MRAALTLPLLLALAGCTRPTTCDVVSFHHLPPPAGERIHVAPAADLGADTADFAAIAALIDQRLGELGYRPVAEAADAELIAHVAYGIEEEEGARSLNVPACSFHYHFGIGRLDRPYWYGYRCRPQPAVTAPLYARHLETRITSASGETLFDGMVRSIGADSSLPDVMPYLVAAMFTNFPGESGVVKTVTIDEDSVLPPPGESALPEAEACHTAPAP